MEKYSSGGLVVTKQSHSLICHFSLLGQRTQNWKKYTVFIRGTILEDNEKCTLIVFPGHMKSLGFNLIYLHHFDGFFYGELFIL